MEISVSGTGYVGSANAVLLAPHNEVLAIDIVPAKIALLNNRQLPLADTEIKNVLAHKTLNERATLDKVDAYANADFVIIATSTDYNTTERPKSVTTGTVQLAGPNIDTICSELIALGFEE